MKQWKLLADEANAQLNLIRTTAKLCGECDDECGQDNRLSSCMLDLMLEGEKGFTNGERKGILKYLLEELRDEVDSLDLDDVETRLHELKGKRKAFAEFIEHDTPNSLEPIGGEHAVEASPSSSPTPSEL